MFSMLMFARPFSRVLIVSVPSRIIVMFPVAFKTLTLTKTVSPDSISSGISMTMTESILGSIGSSSTVNA